MKTADSPAQVSIHKKIQRFYDIGSPFFLEIFGPHFHDGYYITGQESKVEAQENLIKLLVEKAGIRRGAAVLDVGCGAGGSSLWLARHLGAQTTGITLSPVQVEIANRAAREQRSNSTFILMNAEEMDFPQPFDVVWLVAALVHFQDQKNFFRRVARYLKPKGKLVLFDWTLDGSPVGSSDRDIRLIKEGLVLSNLYSAGTYTQWLQESSFRITHSEDITAQTLKTWDDAISLIKEPATWRFVYEVARNEGPGIFTFLKSLRAMKRAQKKGRIKSAVIIAERI